MSDDVKVKFGGDFSDISKGASEAANRAGSSMKSWANDFGKSLAGSFAGIFAAEAVIGAIKDFGSGVRDQLNYFRELSHVIEKTNVDSREFQQLAGYAKENGVAMETLGRGMAFANVYLGKLKDGTKAAREELKALKFTDDEINSGRIKSINILMRLADAYQVEGQEAQVAEHLKKIFGKSGIELLPMMKEGSSAMRERMEEVKVYSDYEIKAAANLAKILDAAERKKKELERRVAVTAGVSVDETKIGEAQSEALKEIRRRYKITRPEARERITSSPEAASEYAEILKEKLKAARIKPEMAILAQASKVAGMEAAEQGRAEPSEALINARALLTALTAIKEKTQGVTIGQTTEGTSGNAALAVSSLQAIGGGDVASIFAGTYQDTMLAQTTRIADATTKTAENTVPTPFRQPGPQPATK